MDADTTTVHSSLNRCPECRYSLRELPVPHACPECGFSYDADSRAWYPVAGRRAVFGGFIGYAGGSISMLFNAWVWVGRFGPWAWLFLVVWIAGGVWLFWWCLRIYRLGSYVSIGPDGVRIRVQSPTTQVVPWSDLAGVTLRRFDRVCLLKCRDGRVVPVGGVFRSSEDVVNFAHWVEDYLQRQSDTAADA